MRGEHRQKVSRRSFIGRCLALCSGLLAFMGCGSWRRFSVSSGQRSTLRAATERILPGAHQAGVSEYIERALGDRFYHGWRQPMREGLDLLTALARDRYSNEFTTCSPDEQDTLLAHVQEEAAPQFFSQLHTMTLEGFLGDPVHGGNRNESGWRFLGYKPGGPRPGNCGGHKHR